MAETMNAPDSLGDTIAAIEASIPNHVQGAVDAESMRYQQEKREAIEQYVTDLRVEVLRAILKRANAVPFVRRGLHANDEPEGHRLPDAITRLGDAWEQVARRALHVHELANAMNNEGGVNDPYDPKYWDQVRLQKAGTHAAAVELLAEGFILAFACDQYASAKYVWRGGEPDAPG